MAREYKDSGIEWIGQIPKEWKVVRTKNVFSLGKELVGTNSSQSQLLSLTTKGIKEVSVGSTSGKVPTSYDTYQLVHKNNLVFCLFDLDCSAVFAGVSNYEGMISPAYKVVSMQEGYYPQFYGYWFDYIFDGRKYKYLSKNIRYSLTYDEFAALGIVAPHFGEQQKIADYLDKICGEADEMIALQEKMIEELKAYKQSIITEAVTKGLNPNAPMKNSGIDWIGEIPEHWGICRIRNMVETQSGSNLTTTEISDIGDYPVYGGNGIRGFYNDFLIEGDYVLIGRQGALCGNINYAHGKFWATEHAVVCYPKRDFETIWFGELLRAMNLGQYSLSSAQPGLAVERIRNLKIPLPSISEQRQIASFLDTKCSEIDSLIAIKQHKITELKEYKKSVIYEYVTGKKEVV